MLGLHIEYPSAVSENSAHMLYWLNSFSYV